ncbi:hypothetical protein ACWEOO_06735 [Kribbella sp. NPDC004138]
MPDQATDWFSLVREMVAPTVISAEAAKCLMDRATDVFSALPLLHHVRLYGVDTGFFYFPLSLAAFYGDESQDSLLRLAVSIAVGHGHFALVDRMLDEQVVSPPSLPAAQIMMTTYLARMERDFGDLLDVRAVHDRFYDDYASAVLIEHAQRRQLRAISSDDLPILGMKSAPACMPLNAILLASGRDDIVDEAEAAFLLFAGSLQLLDDLADLTVDYRDGLSSIPLNLILYHSMGLRGWPSNDVDEDDLVALSVISGAREACLQMAADRLAEVRRLSEAIGMVPLAQAATRRLRHTQQKLVACADPSPARP